MKDSEITSLITKGIEENNTFLLKNIESIMKDHKEPSPRTVEQIGRLDERMEEMKKDNEKSDVQILEKLNEMKGAQEKWMQGMKETHKELEGKVRELQDWRLVSKTERALAYALASFFGAIVASLIVMVFNIYIFK